MDECEERTPLLPHRPANCRLDNGGRSRRTCDTPGANGTMAGSGCSPPDGTPPPTPQRAARPGESECGGRNPMTEPFQYPAAPHVRRHGPQGYADAASFRPWLRDEFTFRCVYCLQREVWGTVR